METWSVYAERWASVEPQTGREKYIADVNMALVTHAVTIRHTEGVRPDMRIVLPGNRALNVVYVFDVMERGAEMRLLCMEVDGVAADAAAPSPALLAAASAPADKAREIARVAP